MQTPATESEPFSLQDFEFVASVHFCVCVCFLALMHEQGTHGRGRSGEGQTQEHQERDELVARLHVGHGEVTVVAAVAHHGWGQHICQLQEVEGHQGGEHDGELDGHTHTRTRTRQRQI